MVFSTLKLSAKENPEHPISNQLIHRLNSETPSRIQSPSDFIRPVRDKET